MHLAHKLYVSLKREYENAKINKIGIYTPLVVTLLCKLY